MTKTLTITQPNYEPTDHAGGNSLANASGHATDAARQLVDAAEIGDRIEYETLEEIDDLTRDAVRHGLAARDLAWEDDGVGLRIVEA